MKITGIALIVIGLILFLLAGVTYFASELPTDDVRKEYTFNPVYGFMMAVCSFVVGAMILRFGGRGFTETRPIAVSEEPVKYIRPHRTNGV